MTLARITLSAKGNELKNNLLIPNIVSNGEYYWEVLRMVGGITMIAVNLIIAVSVGWVYCSLSRIIGFLGWEARLYELFALFYYPE